MHLTDDPTLPTGRWLLVVNPTAGAGRALAACEGVVEALRTHGLEPEVYVSPDIDAAEEAAAACGPDDVVVSLGGDGLHGRIAAGTMRGGALFAPCPQAAATTTSGPSDFPSTRSRRPDTSAPRGSGASIWGTSTANPSSA